MSANTAIIAAAAANIQGSKASGVIVKVEPAAFLSILSRIEAPLVVTAEGGVFHHNFQYLTSYKGLAFFTKAHERLELPATCELVLAEAIWVPEL